MINPLTNRKIKNGGPTFKKIELKCIQLERNNRQKKQIDRETIIQKVKESVKPKKKTKKKTNLENLILKKKDEIKTSEKVDIIFKGKKRPFIDVKFQDGGIEVLDSSLIDTGAVRSAISRNVANKLDFNLKYFVSMSAVILLIFQTPTYNP